MCCILIRTEELSQPPQKPPFLCVLALICTVCIQPNNKWSPQPDQIDFSSNMVDPSLLVLKSQLLWGFFPLQNCHLVRGHCNLFWG